MAGILVVRRGYLDISGRDGAGVPSMAVYFKYTVGSSDGASFGTDSVTFGSGSGTTSPGSGTG